MQPHCPVARGRDLVVFEIQELVGRHVFRHDVAVAVGFEHAWEYDAVEHDVVFSDEMHHLGVVRLPPFLPVVAAFLADFLGV